MCQIFCWYRRVVMDHSLIIILMLGSLLAYFIIDTYWSGNLEYVESTVDKNKYLVQALPDKQAAADLLAQIRKHLETLTKHLEKMAPQDPRTHRLVMNFQPSKIQEGVESSKHTSYSVNKGEKIVFCLRSKDNKKELVELNTMMFVALHELAHICTESVGHTEEFWANFRWILEEAINIGIYVEQDFKTKPQPYCGITITDSPLN